MPLSWDCSGILASLFLVFGVYGICAGDGDGVMGTYIGDYLGNFVRMGDVFGPGQIMDTTGHDAQSCTLTVSSFDGDSVDCAATVNFQFSRPTFDECVSRGLPSWLGKFVRYC